MRILAHPNLSTDLKKVEKQVFTKLLTLCSLIKKNNLLPDNNFKKISGTEFSEIRIWYARKTYRIMCRKEGQKLFLLSAFAKKTRKTPTNEIKIAKQRWNELQRQ